MQAASLFTHCRHGELDIHRQGQGHNFVEYCLVSSGLTLLETAIKYNHCHIIRDLLCYDFFPTIDEIQRVALFTANCGSAKAFELVWDAADDPMERLGAFDPNHPEDDCKYIRDVLYEAVKRNNIDVYRVIIDKYYDPDTEDYDLLMYALCSGGHADAVRELIPHTDVHLEPDASLVFHMLVGVPIKRTVTKAQIRNVLDLLIEHDVCVQPEEIPILSLNHFPPEGRENYINAEWEEHSYDEYVEMLWTCIGDGYASTSFIDYVLARVEHTVDEITLSITTALKAHRFPIAQHLLCYAQRQGYVIDFNKLISDNLKNKEMVEFLSTWLGPQNKPL